MADIEDGFGDLRGVLNWGERYVGVEDWVAEEVLGLFFDVDGEVGVG